MRGQFVAIKPTRARVLVSGRSPRHFTQGNRSTGSPFILAHNHVRRATLNFASVQK